MILFSIEEFAAKRRKSQTDLEAHLLPSVVEALHSLSEGETDWDIHLIADAGEEWVKAYQAEGGETSGIRELRKFRRRIEDTLDKTTEESLAANIATWLATAILNSATLAATADDPEPLVLEWVDMNDDHVRHSHREAAGQQRPPGEPFKVGGHDLLYPGDSSAPIEEWINCRCALAPAKAAEQEENIAASAEGDTMDDDNEIAPAIQWHGILAPEGVASGDGRQFAPDSLTFRDLPLPLTWQKTQEDGHNGSVTVARIDSIERRDGLMRASGVFLQTEDADAVIGLIADFGRFGVSVDADNAEYELDEANQTVLFTSARIASASIVSIPAFAEAWVALGPWEDETVEPVDAELVASGAIHMSLGDTATFGRGPGWITNPEDTKRIHDYWTKPGHQGYEEINWGVPGDFNRCRVLVGEKIAANSPEDMRFLNQICAQWHKDAIGIWPGQEASAADTLTDTEMAPGLSLVASGWCAPSEFFQDPELKELTPHTIEGEHVFGHVAGFETCHIGYAEYCQTAPHSSNDYAGFLLKPLTLSDGSNIPVGCLTIGGGHAPSGLRARAAANHYDDVSSVFAYVTVGEDEFGIWYSGCLKPGLTEEQIVEARMANISGDWRDLGNEELDMIAAHAVNVPGFPIPRVKVAASNGRQVSLVAAGVVIQETPAPAIDIAAVAAAVVAEMNAQAERNKELVALSAAYGEED